MEVTIKSKILGREITISRPGSGYLYADINGENGTLGKQICEGGGFMGSTIAYSGDDHEQFKKIARQWYRAYVRNAVEYGIY